MICRLTLKNGDVHHVKIEDVAELTQRIQVALEEYQGDPCYIHLEKVMAPGAVFLGFGNAKFPTDLIVALDQIVTIAIGE